MSVNWVGWKCSISICRNKWCLLTLLTLKNCNIINDVFRCHSLLSLCSCRLCLLFWIFLTFLCCLYNWPEGCCARTLFWLKTLCGNIAWQFNQKTRWSLGGQTCFFLCCTLKKEAAAFSETIVNTCETVHCHIL